MVVLIICTASTLLIGLSVGFLVGRLLMAKEVQRELENPESYMSRMLIKNVEDAGSAVAEISAKAAESYQAQTHCINSCGTWIAKMILEAHKLRGPNP